MNWRLKPALASGALKGPSACQFPNTAGSRSGSGLSVITRSASTSSPVRTKLPFSLRAALLNGSCSWLGWTARRGNGNAGHGVGLLAVEPFFRHVVEKSVELIKLLLREGVVFVVVALGAADGCSQPDRCGRIDPIHDVLRLIFVG